MSIVSFSPHHFRNITSQDIHFDPHLTLISGSNGSGKTSILEAIYILSTGRSFRTRKLESLITRAEPSLDAFYISATIQANNNQHHIGVKKSRTESSLIKIDSELVRSASTLAELSPTQLIEPGNINLLSGSPQIRRKYIDWGVFHVEHDYIALWKSYINCLKQRNSLVRTARIDAVLLDVWDQKLATLGDALNAKRKGYVGQLNEAVAALAATLGLDTEIGLRFLQGWDKSLPLYDALKKQREKDLAKRFTSIGPHRMELQILSDGTLAIDVLSRGQQKILTVALLLAQVQLMQEISGKKVTLLVDDLNAELDKENCARVFEQLLNLNTQLVCTSLDQGLMQQPLNNSISQKVFHVEHGKIRAM